MKFLIGGRVIGGPIGLVFLTILDPHLLSISVGVIVLSAGLGSYFGWNVKRNSTTHCLQVLFQGYLG